ncbi:hypothetical protein CELL_02230 [Cellulomonas sp. T2.31MG-18]|uniref:DUF4082 domain-containing protein n=1 Tax=Cellulomonas sp. T2.31MG-18 TaxID=3157619 RepID=UPI0035E730D9
MTLPPRGLPRRFVPGARATRWLRRGAVAVVAVVLAAVLLVADRPAPAAAESMWGDAAPPGVRVAVDPLAVNVGTAFRPTVSGVVVGLRYWSAAAASAGPDGGLWDAAGQLLAGARFGPASAAGWQTVMLAHPVRLSAGAAYVVSYHVTSGRYPVTEGFLGGSRSPLLQVDPGASGVYGYGGDDVFPTQSWRQSQYWVDVVFRGDPGASPEVLPAASPTTTLSEVPAPEPPTPSASAATTPTPTPSAAPSTPAPTPRPSPRAGAAAPPAKAPPAAPAPAAPLPPASAKPGAGNTGVPAGTVLSPADGLTVTTPNQVLSGLDIHGGVVIQAPGVVIRASRITGTDTNGVLVQSGSVTVVDSEISGFENAIAGDDWTAQRVNIHSVTGDGVKLGSRVTLRASWIHDLTPAPGAHADGAQMQDGVSNLLVAGNTIEPGDPANSAIFLAPDLGPSTDGPVTITGNWLDYGGYALFCLDGANGRYVVRNITISDNRFGANSGYGEFRITVPVTFTGNVDAAGRPLTL